MSSTTEEELLTLPVNHPQAGYTNYDRSPVLGTGTVPPEEQAIYDERTAADEAEAEAVAQAEHEVAVAEAEEDVPDNELPPEGGATSKKSSSTSKPSGEQNH